MPTRATRRKSEQQQQDRFALIQRHVTVLEDRFRHAWDVRRDRWMLEIQRMLPPQLDPNLVAFAGKYSYQSQELEWAVGQHIKTLTLDGPEVDVAALEDGKQAKENAEDFRLWLSALLLRLNFDQRLQRAGHEAVTQGGVAVFRLRACMPVEPDGDTQGAEENIADYADRWLRERQKHMDGAIDDDWFQVEMVNPHSCAWGPVLHDKKVFLEHSTVPYLESRLEERASGKRVLMKEDGSLYLGQGEPHEGTQTEDWTGKTFEFIRHEMFDEETGLWRCTEIVHPTGQEMGQDSSLILDEYDAPVCSYFVVSGGDERLNEQDPHLHYRPRIYPLLVACNLESFWMTVLGCLALKKISDEDVYAELSREFQGNPAAEALLSELGFGTEGSGAGHKWEWERPQPGANKVPVLPFELKRWPNDLDDHVAVILQHIAENKPRYEPNRWQTGVAYEESRETTGSLGLAQMQAAALPDNADVRAMASFFQELLQACRSWMIFWDEGVEGDALKRYPVVTSGEEHGAESGKLVVMTAEKVRRPMAIRVTIQNQTLQEKQLNDQQAFAKYERGVLTFLQLLEELGFDDPHRQARQLNEEYNYQQAFVQFKPVLDAERATRFQALTGLNLSGTMTQSADASMVGQSGGRDPLAGQSGYTLNVPTTQGSQGGSAGAPV